MKRLGQDVTACVLERPRHSDQIESLRSIGAKIVLIPDGDVAGVIMTTQTNNPVDIYLGIGGAPEGVLAAAALQCIGGQMQARLVINSDDEKSRAQKIGIKDLDKKYNYLTMNIKEFQLGLNTSENDVDALINKSNNSIINFL